MLPNLLVATGQLFIQVCLETDIEFIEIVECFKELLFHCENLFVLPVGRRTR